MHSVDCSARDFKGQAVVQCNGGVECNGRVVECNGKAEIRSKHIKGSK